MKKILFAASEAVPFIKTGGLADVVGSLPKCFDKRYFDVRVIIPKYLCIKQEWRDKMQYVDHFYMDYLGQSRYVGILEYVYEGITFYFIDNERRHIGEIDSLVRRCQVFDACHPVIVVFTVDVSHFY